MRREPNGDIKEYPGTEHRKARGSRFLKAFKMDASNPISQLPVYALNPNPNESILRQFKNMGPRKVIRKDSADLGREFSLAIPRLRSEARLIQSFFASVTPSSIKFATYATIGDPMMQQSDGGNLESAPSSIGNEPASPPCGKIWLPGRDRSKVSDSHSGF